MINCNIVGITGVTYSELLCMSMHDLHILDVRSRQIHEQKVKEYESNR